MDYHIYRTKKNYRYVDKGHALRDLNVIFGRSCVEVISKVYARRIGLLALAIEPILLAAVYFLLSLVIFPSTLSGNYFLAVFASLIVFRGFQKTLEATTVSIVSNSELIRSGVLTSAQVMLGSWTTEFILSFLQIPILAGFALLLGAHLELSFLLIPLTLAMATLISLSLAPLFAWLGIAVRGSVSFILPFIGLLWYFTPAIYDPSKVKGFAITVYSLNPLAQLVQRVKSIFLIDSGSLNLIPLGSLLGITLLTTVVSISLFDRYSYRLSRYL
ncbi:MAG: hypothetical protein RL589_55 [Actinomycetota bacterium]|jgi:ABC-type polysaccharide/polyol phosphate export permease